MFESATSILFLLKNYNALLNLDTIHLDCAGNLWRDQFGVESSSNLFLAQNLPTKLRFPSRSCGLWNKQVHEPTLQWSAVLLIHMKARECVPLTNVENQTVTVK